MPAKHASISAAQIRNFRPPVCSQTGNSSLRRLYPGITLTREARADLREWALSVLDEPDATVSDRVEASLILAHCLWSQGVVAGLVQRPFFGWLGDHVASGEAYLLDEDRDASNQIRAALGLSLLQTPKSGGRKPKMAPQLGAATA